jgi:hypothetical protein
MSVGAQRRRSSNALWHVCGASPHGLQNRMVDATNPCGLAPQHMTGLHIHGGAAPLQRFHVSQ